MAEVTCDKQLTALFMIDPYNESGGGSSSRPPLHGRGPSCSSPHDAVRVAAVSIKR